MKTKIVAEKHPHAFPEVVEYCENCDKRIGWIGAFKKMRHAKKFAELLKAERK